MTHGLRVVPVGRTVRIGVRLRSELPAWSRLRKITAGALAALRERVGIHVRKSWVADRVLWIELEASSKKALTAAMRGFGVRVAKAVNAKLGRSGGVLADRYELVVPIARTIRQRIVDAAKAAASEGAGDVRDLGPPLVAAAKAALALAATPFMLRTVLSGMNGGGLSAEDRREIIREENEEIRAWQRDLEKRRWKHIAKASAADRAEREFLEHFERRLRESGADAEEAARTTRELKRDLSAATNEDERVSRRIQDWRDEVLEKQRQRREERAKAKAEPARPWWRLWR